MDRQIRAFHKNINFSSLLLMQKDAYSSALKYHVTTMYIIVNLDNSSSCYRKNIEIYTLEKMFLA